MREKTILISIALAIMITGVFLNLPEAHAAYPNPTVYVDTTLNRATPLLTPIIVAAKTSVGATQLFYIKVARAPHETTEPTALGTDKTFAYQFRLSWDPSMFYLRLASHVIEEPATVSTTANFLKRRQYTYTGVSGVDGSTIWEIGSIYQTSFAKSNDTGTVLCGNTLTADPTTAPLPSEYFDPTIGPTAPDVGRQMGDNYDLPYTENATQAVLQLDGSTIVTDPQYVLLGVITLTAKAIPPAGTYPGSAFHLSDILLFNYGSPNPAPYTPVDTFDAYYVKVPVVPEFPLGLGIIMMLAPAIPIAYIWRSRRKAIKK